jgi:hypothetical protein
VTKCSLCWVPITAHTKDEHHRIKRSKGGQDFTTNRIFICTQCHRLIHVGESLLLKGRQDEAVLDFYRTTIIPLKRYRDLEETIRDLLHAAKDAAFLADKQVRVLQPIEIKVPVSLLQTFSRKARDLNVSRNDLVLWCMRECVEGRTALPLSKTT